MTETPSLPRRLFTWAGGYIGCAATLSVCLGCAIGLGLGVLVGEQNGYQRRYLEEKELVEPILAGDPAFAGVRIQRRSNGGIDLIGDVPTVADRERLRGHVARALGENRAQEIVLGVGPFPK
jgi:hypothetical protein